MKTVLISGGSIAGPALAHQLGRYGFRTTLVEKAPAPREGGQAVDFRGTAHLTVLERMGILDEIRRLQTHLGAVAVVNGDGKQISSLPSIMSGDVEIARGDLSRVFYEATKDRTEYAFGDSISSLNEHADGVDVTFERSAPRTFDLVVGADGAHSGVRRLAFGPESDFRRDLGVCSAVFTVPNQFGLDHRALMYSTPGKGAYVYSKRNTAEATAALFFASRRLEYDHRDTEQHKDIVTGVFANEGWQVPWLLRAMRDAPDFYFDRASQIHIDRYSTGRVVLLGDAGYAGGPGAMGTGLAVVGAYVLAGELAAAPDDHRTAFARYEEQIRPYAAVCQKQAEGMDRFLVPGTRSQIWTRNLMWKALPYLPWKGIINKLTTKAANAITLKEYAKEGELGQRLVSVDG
ncbi:FAD-dependent monooxygenase [Streptomyces silvisoli]|uniref:FAD-dependent monooxygenase n=1 Tax=Streptomyces silvisoli TaxID=3034235 RepID=A0ABT5ZT00_9ACTN|nr:FAD-dependent monooxygenase [Streptomyces silvisoli]MDF3292776.1 FAD-dependent monooxygenase [Streptomyces silvisoli]